MARYNSSSPTHIASIKTFYAKSCNRQSRSCTCPRMYGRPQITKLFWGSVSNLLMPTPRRHCRHCSLYLSFRVSRVQEAMAELNSGNYFVLFWKTMTFGKRSVSTPATTTVPTTYCVGFLIKSCRKRALIGMRGRQHRIRCHGHVINLAV